jgi:hypothetical protein
MSDNKYTFICDKCDFKCKFKSRWDVHINTTLHKTGKKKLRIDYEGLHKCDKCDYESENNTNFKKHVLNSHSTKEEREKQFKFYCKLCNFGTFSNDTMNLHKESNKHKNFETIFNNKK